MNVLTMLSKRIEHIENHLPKFTHVAREAIKVLNQFFVSELPQELINASNVEKLRYRKTHINNLVNQLPKNIEIKKHLMNFGYHETLWEKDLWIETVIEDRRNIEENYKTSLIGIYGEYIDILKTLYPGIKSLIIDSNEVPIEKIFCDDHQVSLSVEDLKSRRNVVLKAIDKKIKFHSQKSFLTNRKLSLLAREEKLDFDVERQRQQEKFEVPQKRHYWCRLNNTFFNKAACCGKSIVGCYAPDGDHAEKPIENALKANVTFISLFDESKENSRQLGTEIENVEVLFTDQGLYIFKLYSNGHPYDTSLVWALFFKALVESNLIPAIIIPKHFPNNRTFNLIENFIPSQLSGSPITFRDDFFDEAGVQSYYDFKVEKIKAGDIVLNSQNIHLLKLPDMNEINKEKQQGRTLLRRSNNATALATPVAPTPKAYHLIRKDLAGLILTRVILKIKTDPRFATHSDKAEACARFLSEYISLYIEKGIKDYDILTLGFDLDQYARRKRRKKGNINQFIQSDLIQKEKETFLRNIVNAVQEELRKFYNSKEKLKALFYNERELFFELQNHFQNVVKNLHRNPKEFHAIEGIELHRQIRQNHNPRICERDALDDEIRPASQQLHGPRELPEERYPQQNVSENAAHFFLTSEEIEWEQNQAQCILVKIRQILREAPFIVKISELNTKLQYQVMKWIFGNEDRVWRDRGGRPGEETLQTFINFVTIEPSSGSNIQAIATNNNNTGNQKLLNENTNAISIPNQKSTASTARSTTNSSANMSASTSFNEELSDKDEKGEMRSDHYGKLPFGGYIAVAPRPKRKNSFSDEKEFDIDEFNANEVLNEMSKFNLAEMETLDRAEIVAYCVGDWVDKDKFEAVTAWTHPHYRRLGLAHELYQRTMEEIRRQGGKWLVFDTLERSLETIILSSPSLSLLHKLGFYKLCVPYRKKSYTADCRDGTTEVFEKSKINLEWFFLGSKLLKAKNFIVRMAKLLTLNFGNEEKNAPFQHTPFDIGEQILGII
jgi:ribosomal protein S18 acetylase RimI-like enzyme